MRASRSSMRWHRSLVFWKVIVFLREGLGSLSMWRDSPAKLCAATGARGLVWSRFIYCRSTPRASDEFWDVDFMHRQAHEVMPAS